MPIPLRQHIEDGVDSSHYHDRFKELSKDVGCRLHDPLPDMLRHPQKERRLFRFPSDDHFTPAGHEVIARSLKPVVMELFEGLSLS
jgi:carbamoyltransferase